MSDDRTGAEGAGGEQLRNDVIAEMLRQNQIMINEMKQHMEAKFEERLKIAVAEIESKSRWSPTAHVAGGPPPRDGAESPAGSEEEREEDPPPAHRAHEGGGRTVVRMHYESSEKAKPISLSSLGEDRSGGGGGPVEGGGRGPARESRSPDRTPAPPAVREEDATLPSAPVELDLDDKFEARLPRSVRNMMQRTEYFLGGKGKRKGKRDKVSATIGAYDTSREVVESSDVKLPTLAKTPANSSSGRAGEPRGSQSGAGRRRAPRRVGGRDSASPALLEKNLSSPALMDPGAGRGGADQAADPHYVTTADNSLKSPVSRSGVNKTSGDWENDIARHILSVYASSIAKRDIVTSDATLEFVEGAKSKQKKKSVQPGAAGDDSARCSAAALGDVVKQQSAAGDEDYTKLFNRKKFHVEHIARVRGGAGRTVVIRGPPKCFPIYFAGSRDVFFDWTLLCLDPLNGLRFQAHVTKLKEEKRYMEYLKLVENVLTVAWEEYLVSERSGAHSTGAGEQVPASSSSSTSTSVVKEQYMSGISSERGYDATILKRSSGGRNNFSLTANTNSGGVFSFGGTDNNRVTPRSKKELKEFWKQLVLTANAFATLLLESNDSATALLILQLADGWSNRDDVFSTAFRVEIRSYTNFTYAYLFYKSGKSSAAMSHCLKAVAVSEKRGNFDLVCTGYLQLSCMYFAKADFITCHEYLYKVLTMVEEGSISMTDPNPERLCMVALAYHNLAVVQLKLMCPDAACKSSQNAQKIARLCLSYSNRWLPTFHWTHQVCLEEIEYNLKQQNVIPDDKMGVMGAQARKKKKPKGG